MKSNVSKLITTFVLLLTIFVSNSQAYDADTHFWLTYYLAVKVGYTPKQAQQIASADVSVDYDAQTAPVVSANLHMQDIRKEFHAFPSTSVVRELRNALRTQKRLTCDGILTDQIDPLVECLITEQEKLRWDEAKEIGNPGVYLHFYQDRFAHRGFTTRIGHYRLFHLPDFLASDRDKASEMMAGTIIKLQDFMREKLGKEPLEPNATETAQVLDQLIQANPSAKLSDYYTEDWRNWNPGFLELPIPGINNSPFRNSPDVAQARKVIQQSLLGIISANEPKILQYNYNNNGKPQRESSIGTLEEVNNNQGVFIKLEFRGNRSNSEAVPFKL